MQCSGAVFVHSRSPSLAVRVWRSLWPEVQQGLSVPWVHCWAGELWKHCHSLSIKCISGSPCPQRLLKERGQSQQTALQDFFLMHRELLMATMELKPPQQKKTMDLSKARIFCFIAKCLMQKIFAVARWDQPHSRTQLFFLQLCAKAHSCPVHFLLFYLFS